MTHQRARKLAARFEQANQAAIAEVERCPEQQLGAICPAEQATVAALACHMADVHQLGAEWVRTVVAGRPLPQVTMDLVDIANADQFARYADCPKAQAVDRLRRNGQETAALLRGLSDADLDRTSPFALFGGTEVSVEGLIEHVLIADPVSHVHSLRATLEQGVEATPDRA